MHQNQQDSEYYMNLLRFTCKALFGVVCVLLLPIAIVGLIFACVFYLVGTFAVELVDPALLILCDDGSLVCLYAWLE